MSEPWDFREIRKRLLEDVTWMERAILAIYKQQTLDEQWEGVSMYANGKGFNRDDAEYGTIWAMWLQDGGRLKDNPHALKWAMQEMPKYARQLALIANGQLQVVSK